MNNLKMEFLILLRNRSVILLCSAYLIVGLLALGFGVQRFYSEKNQIAELATRYDHDVAEWEQKVDSMGAGYAAYYLFNPVVFQPSPWSALFTGERKENFVLQRVRLLAVHGQIHGSTINNSEHSSLGVLDVQFVWLYLLPLLVGLITVTCIADDRRLGRLPLLSSITSIKLLLARRVTVRFGLIALINILMIILACLFLPIAFESDLLWVFSASIAYQAFWFLVSSIIILIFLNARQSILTFVAVWMASSWLVPTIHYSGSLNADTYNAGVELLVNQRQDMNDSWDRDKQADLQQFLSQYPQWQDTTPLGESFDWKWYFAMQKRSDDKVSDLASQYLENKTDTESIWQWLSPTLMTQTLFEDIANTGASDYQNWLKSIVDWHNRSQSFWFPYFFFDKTFHKEDLNIIPKFELEASYDSTKSLTAYWVIIAILCFTLFFALNKRNPQSSSTKVSL